VKAVPVTTVSGDRHGGAAVKSGVHERQWLVVMPGKLRRAVPSPTITERPRIIRAATDTR
jgi:hypothetical protein